MQHTFTYHEDAAHGWVKAPRGLVELLGLADKISECSYQLGDNVYLEEDCDAPLFIETFRERFGSIRLVVKRSECSRIRNYHRYENRIVVA
jgi:hypothetical protein